MKDLEAWALPKAFLFVWFQTGTQEVLAGSQAGIQVQVQGDRSRGGVDDSALQSLESTWVSWLSLSWSLTQFFLVLGVSYFRLLEYQRSSGMPMDGSVMTPKAAQSRKCGENRRSNSR